MSGVVSFTCVFSYTLNARKTEFSFDRYVRGRRPYAPGVPLSQSYVCFRCGKPGHFIRNCPTNGVSGGKLTLDYMNLTVRFCKVVFFLHATVIRLVSLEYGKSHICFGFALLP